MRCTLKLLVMRLQKLSKIDIMKLFENIKDWWNSFLDDYHQSSTDKLVKKAFHKIIQSESNDRNSFFIILNIELL